MHRISPSGWVTVFCSVVLLGVVSCGAQTLGEEEVRQIGSRLELFVDEYLIESMNGVTRKLHSPQRANIAIEFDSPWDGECSHYATMFKDNDIFRMYYRGLPVAKHWKEFPGAATSQWEHLGIVGPSVTCYAESEDGIHWTKPNLGLFESVHTGNSSNNIVLAATDKWPGVTRNLAVFKDTNPDCPSAARYKAVGRHVLGASDTSHVGNLGFRSPDGIHWSLIQDAPLHEDRGHVFDAFNTAFWDPMREVYVEYHRKFRDQPGHPMQGLRDMRTSTSPDFIHWTEPQFVEYGDAPGEHIYELLVIPYFRSPHIYLGFVNRFVASRDDFLDHPAGGICDAVLLSSRDGVNFDRSFMEAWIRPGTDVGNWIHAATSPAWALLQTGPEELSVYWIQNYYQPERTCYLQRGTLRLDGFVSVHADYAGGDFITKPLTFEGEELVMNYSTSAVGSVRVEIQDQEGNPIPGFTLADCPEIYGDAIEEVVKWKGGSDVSALGGQVVRLRFVLEDADLYAIRFRP